MIDEMSVTLFIANSKFHCKKVCVSFMVNLPELFEVANQGHRIPADRTMAYVWLGRVGRGLTFGCQQG